VDWETFFAELWARLKSAEAWVAIIAFVNAMLPVLWATVSTAQLQAINAALALVAFLLFGVRVGVSYVRARRAK
jgi:hypothetical protein